jgi:XTP/dITP diphosphohydrolase
MKFVLATHNAHKVVELAAILGTMVPGLELVGYDGPEPVEDGVSYAENALIKARAAHAHTGLPAIADDSGIAVEVLGGSPGIFSARWSGTRDAIANRRLLLEQLRDVKPEHRAAAFVCTIALVGLESEADDDADSDSPSEITFTGIWHGAVGHEERGEAGFGYDPIFVPEGFEVSAAELEPEVKNSMSHRTLAIEQLASFLNQS